MNGKFKKFTDKIYTLKALTRYNNKFKIISESWCNVLLSKSEILSLSVLEAFSMGTQSFVNKKIFFPNWIKRYLIRSKVKDTILSNNIQKIMNILLKKKLYR